MIQEGLGLEECRALNIGQSNWNTEDYIRSYASTGNQSYIWLLRLWIEYKKDFGGEVVLMASKPIERMNADPLSMVSCSRIEDQLKYFDEVWNKGRRAENRVFMSTDFQRRLYID